MRKLFYIGLVATSLISFASCNNSGDKPKDENQVDAVDSAKDANKEKQEMMADDSKFMTEAAAGGMMEVDAGKMMVGATANPEVKAFAQMMVDDHGKANEELKTLAAQKNVTLPMEPSEEMKSDMAKMKDKKGKDLDKAYVDEMVSDHEKDVDHFKKAATDAKDPDLKAWAGKMLPTLEAHLDHAKKLQDMMKKK